MEPFVISTFVSSVIFIPILFAWVWYIRWASRGFRSSSKNEQLRDGDIRQGSGHGTVDEQHWTIHPQVHETVKPRKQYLMDARMCQCCMRAPAVEVHEITRGAARQAALVERCSWLALCRGCHELMGDYSVWPVERQCALKMLVDPKHFDLLKICELRGRAPTAITMEDIKPYLRGLR